MEPNDNIIFISNEGDEEWEKEWFDEEWYYDRNLNKYTGTLLDEDWIDTEWVDWAGHQIYGGELTETCNYEIDEEF